VKNLELETILNRSEAYEQGVTVLAEGSIDHAIKMYIASNPRWAGFAFANLPRTRQLEVPPIGAGEIKGEKPAALWRKSGGRLGGEGPKKNEPRSHRVAP
jgi:hypothetical protein